MAAGSIDGFGECRLTVTGSCEALQAPEVEEGIE